MKRILIVEDEPKLARLMSRVLREEGYAPDTAGDGRSGFARALEEDFELLILDWMLPDRSGVQIVRGLRAADVTTPVLMLTARTQVEDRVEGLDAGADDYLTKPFAFAELLARVRALTRRPKSDVKESSLVVGDVSLDPVHHIVRCGEQKVDLTAREFSLLATLMQSPGRVYTRSVLLDTVWGGTPDVYANVVDLYISYLRKKLDGSGRRSHIRTVRGVGYTFEPET